MTREFARLPGRCRALDRRCVLAGLAVLPGAAAARGPEERKRPVVFIGNSFTRQHDIAGLVGRIARTASHSIDSTVWTRDGGDLAALYKHLRRIAHDAEWSRATVVLQDHSTVALNARRRRVSCQAMQAFGIRFAGTVLFETWPRRAGHPFYSGPRRPRDPAEMAAMVHRHYSAQADRLAATLAPVGTAWIAAGNAGLDLYARDGYHANPAGAWLAAMMLARALQVPRPFDAPPPPHVPPDAARTLSVIARTASG